MKRATTLEIGKSFDNKSGFTMVELMVVISVIVVLMAMLAMSAGGLQRRANVAATDGLLQRTGLFIDSYHGKTGSYPADGIDRAVITEEGTPVQSGSALAFALTRPILNREKLPTGEYRVVSSEPAVGEFKGDELSEPFAEDPGARELVDTWGIPLHYDNLEGGRNAYSPQNEGDVHLFWDDLEFDGAVHSLDPRELDGVATSGPQNIGEYDLFSHGGEGHTEDELPEECIGNWAQ